MRIVSYSAILIGGRPTEAGVLCSHQRQERLWITLVVRFYGSLPKLKDILHYFKKVLKREKLLLI